MASEAGVSNCALIDSAEVKAVIEAEKANTNVSVPKTDTADTSNTTVSTPSKSDSDSVSNDTAATPTEPSKPDTSTEPSEPSNQRFLRNQNSRKLHETGINRWQIQGTLLC